MRRCIPGTGSSAGPFRGPWNAPRSAARPLRPADRSVALHPLEPHVHAALVLVRRGHGVAEDDLPLSIGHARRALARAPHEGCSRTDSPARDGWSTLRPRNGSIRRRDEAKPIDEVTSLARMPGSSPSVRPRRIRVPRSRACTRPYGAPGRVRRAWAGSRPPRASRQGWARRHLTRRSEPIGLVERTEECCAGPTSS